MAFRRFEFGNFACLFAAAASPAAFFAAAFSIFSFSFLARNSLVFPLATMLATSSTPSLSSPSLTSRSWSSSPTSVSGPGPLGCAPRPSPDPVAPVEATTAGFTACSSVPSSPGSSVPAGRISHTGLFFSCSHISFVKPFALSKSCSLCVIASPPHPTSPAPLPRSCTTKSLTVVTSHFPSPTSTTVAVAVAYA